MSGIFEETENQHRIPQEKLQANRMHCTYLTYLLALSKSLPASIACTHVSHKAHGHIDGWLALSNLRAIQCLVTQPSPVSPAQK